MAKKQKLARGTERDPLRALGNGLMLEAIRKLEPVDLGRCMAVSKSWRDCAADDLLWEEPCESISRGKDQVSFSSPVSQGKYELYRKLYEDSTRTRITTDELCGLAWNFRLKEAVGSYWIEFDPSWRGEPPMRRIFHPDGFVSAGPDDSVWGGHECYWSRVDGTIRVNNWPPLSISRTSSWGWRMENMFVVYFANEKLLNT